MRFLSVLLALVAASYLGSPVMAQKAGLRGEIDDKDKPLTVSGSAECRGQNVGEALATGPLLGLTPCLLTSYNG